MIHDNVFLVRYSGFKCPICVPTIPWVQGGSLGFAINFDAVSLQFACHACVHSCKHAFVQTCTHADMRAYAHAFTSTHRYINASAHRTMFAKLLMDASAHAYMCTCMHVFAHG